MTKKEALTRLENTRVAVKPLKSFKGKAALESQIRSKIRFLEGYRADDLADLFIKEIDNLVSATIKQIPDRRAELDTVLKTCRGELVLESAI